jgi:hypothetical protein
MDRPPRCISGVVTSAGVAVERFVAERTTPGALGIDAIRAYVGIGPELSGDERRAVRVVLKLREK